MMNDNRQTANNGVKGITALYSRLSREDSLDGQSLSIQNQQQILEDYATKQGFTNTRHFADDGTTGVRFDRDQWNKLIAEVEAGNVSIICVKDMSRIGREHVQTGMYMEIFRRLKVRFIAIGNNIDSDIPESLEYAPFINIMSEWFARDTSRKIKTVAHARGNAGKPLSYNAIYGYRKSPEDKHTWLVDEVPAAIVRRIFQMTIGGMGPFQIARQLTEEKIEKPSYYFAKNRMVGDKPSTRDLSDPYTWTGNTIAAMLKKPEYLGHVINFRTVKESYKDKQSKKNPEDNWKIFHNAHEPIIDQETFDTVQRLRSTPRRVDSVGQANPLTGIMYCADCGAKMYNTRHAADYYDEHRFGKVYKHKTTDFYNCSTHKLGTAAFKTDTTCSNHFIRTVVVRELVLDAIKRISEYVQTNEAEFVEKIREASAVRQEETAKTHKKQIGINQRRIAELDNLFRRVYEDNASGKLSDERYEMLSQGYDREQAELKTLTAGMQAELDAWSEDSLKADRFVDIVHRYTSFDELTTPMLNEFINRIYVREADKSTGERIQDVVIHFNFIDNFEIPMDQTPPNAEEIEAENKRLEKLAKQREYNRRWYAKKKAEQEFNRAVEAGEVSQEELESIERERAAEAQAEQHRREEREAEKREYKRQWAAKDREKKRGENGKSQRALRQDEFKLMTPEQRTEEKRQWRNNWQRQYRADKKAQQAAVAL
jgi:hypothetical protein